MADSDYDRLPDGDEDPDGDRLVNRFESLLQWHPRNLDTDGDGILDGDENAGTVTATTVDSVTIALLRGGTLKANLTDFTDVVCAASAAAGAEEEELTEEELAAEGLEAEEDMAFEGDPQDGFGDEDFEETDDGFRRSSRQAALDGCAIDVGAIVYGADVDEWDGVLEFVTLDLLGA
jgi:hypothetical protein